jgi:hypothetical protein
MNEESPDAVQGEPPATEPSDGGVAATHPDASGKASGAAQHETCNRATTGSAAAGGAANVSAETTAAAANPLTPAEQMALFEQELKENDWGHQPC